jgi:hypothetical protein
MLNPVIFDDWMQASEDNSYSSVFRDWFINPIIRRAVTIMRCAYNDPRLGKFAVYLRTGNIRDVRMTNDPLTKILSRLSIVCANNLPHAQIEWLYNTSSCSAKGHAIETVVRELRACR